MSTLSLRNPTYLLSIGIIIAAILNPEVQASPLQQSHPDTSFSGLITAIEDGHYQFCTQPDPQNWQDGAGVCLVMQKEGVHIQGYYGYPHSDSLICLQGHSSEKSIVGQAATPVHMGSPFIGTPESAFYWDQEQHLLLHGQDSQMLSDPETGFHWVMLSQASLDLQGFYAYPSVRMRSPDELCPWALMSNSQD